MKQYTTTEDVFRLRTLREELVMALLLSRGWWKRISIESGCSLYTLGRIAHEPDFDPSYDAVQRIDAWFIVNGIQRRGPQGKGPDGAWGEREAAGKANRFRDENQLDFVEQLAAEGKTTSAA